MGGLRTGSTTVITFNVDVPQTGDYPVHLRREQLGHAADVSGPTNVFLRVDGGRRSQVWLPVGYNWVIWNHGRHHRAPTAGRPVSLSTTGDNGAATNGDAIINKIDLQLEDPAVTGPRYEAEQATWTAPRPITAPGPVRRRGGRHRPGQGVTFWVYSAADGYSDLAFRYKSAGSAHVEVNAQPLSGQLAGPGARAGRS